LTFSSSTGFFCLFKDRVLFHVFILWYLQVLYAYGTVNASLSQSTASINTYLGFTSIFKAVGYLSVHMQHFLNVLPWSIWDTPPFCLRIIVHWFFFTLKLNKSNCFNCYFVCLDFCNYRSCSMFNFFHQNIGDFIRKPKEKI
jgi:hypothetical protein